MAAKITATLPDGTVAVRRSDRPYAFVVAVSPLSAAEAAANRIESAERHESVAAQWRAAEFGPAEPALSSMGRPMAGLMVRVSTKLGYAARGFGETAEEALADAQKSVASMIAREEQTAADYRTLAAQSEDSAWSVMRWSHTEDLARKAAASKEFQWVARSGRTLRVLPVD